MYNKSKLWIEGAKYMFSNEILKALGLSLKLQNAITDVSSRFTLTVECLGQQISQRNYQAQYTEIETMQLK